MAQQPVLKSTEQIHDDLKEEYYTLTDIVTSFDQRLLTIKGWGVTFSLATLALAFQQNHYGLFLVAAASALAFWVIEGSVKLHQMRYYPRMGDIEVAALTSIAWKPTAALYRRRSSTGVGIPDGRE